MAKKKTTKDDPGIAVPDERYVWFGAGGPDAESGTKRKGYVWAPGTQPPADDDYGNPVPGTVYDQGQSPDSSQKKAQRKPKKKRK